MIRMSFATSWFCPGTLSQFVGQAGMTLAALTSKYQYCGALPFAGLSGFRP
jgi:hypothetical protein